MIIAVQQNCLSNHEVLRRVKVFELMGDSIFLISDNLDASQELMEEVGVDWPVLHNEEATGYDVLFGCACSEGRNVSAI